MKQRGAFGYQDQIKCGRTRSRRSGKVRQRKENYRVARKYAGDIAVDIRDGKFCLGVMLMMME